MASGHGDATIPHLENDVNSFELLSKAALGFGNVTGVPLHHAHRLDSSVASQFAREVANEGVVRFCGAEVSSEECFAAIARGGVLGGDGTCDYLAVLSGGGTSRPELEWSE